MKLRIDPEKISFRLDFDELEQLLEQGGMQEVIALPEGNLTYKIICLPAGSAPAFQAGAETYSLSLARDVIEDHKSALPSLKGIIVKFPTRNGSKINVSLEVNLKKKLKRSLGSQDLQP